MRLGRKILCDVRMSRYHVCMHEHTCLAGITISTSGTWASNAKEKEAVEGSLCGRVEAGVLSNTSFLVHSQPVIPTPFVY